MADYPIRTREQAFLAKAGGADVDIEPKNGNEYWLLQALGGGGDGGEIIIPEQTVTEWEANIAPQGYAKWVDGADVESLPEELIVTFNGTKYSLEKKSFMSDDYYGATISLDSDNHVVADWTEYPLVITRPEDKWTVFVETDGQTVTIKAVAK